MAEADVPDSTDWLSTPLSGLAAVESALRCQVCKDFFKTPMITSCSHTFCSLCIRRALSNDSKCPLCRASDQELKLRSNWSMEETVEAFVKARDVAMELARSGESSSLVKRKADDGPNEASTAPAGKRIRTSARLSKTREDGPISHTMAFEDEIVEVPDDDEYVPEPEDGMVPCPVCKSRMKEWQVFKHLESCSGPPPSKPIRAAESSSSSKAGFGQLQRQQTKSLDRLPALSYSMFKEQALRKKMSEIGISNQGPRALLERRHKEWITLWNANCDAVRPKKRSELLQDLDIWERTQGGRAPVIGRTAQSAAMIKDKDFDGAAWASKHDSSFKDLIASARKSKLEAKKVDEAKKEAEAKQVVHMESSSEAPPPPPPVLETKQVEMLAEPTILTLQSTQKRSANVPPGPPPQDLGSLESPQDLTNNQWSPPHQMQPSTQSGWQPFPPATYPQPYNAQPYNAESYAYQSDLNARMTPQQQPVTAWNSSVPSINPSPYAETEEFPYHNRSHVWPPDGPNGWQ